MYSVWNSFLPWVLLCLLNSIATEPIIIEEKEVTRQEGSCVTINCRYEYENEMQLLWIKDPVWINKTFDGMIVYSNTLERPQVSEYSNRVEFFNNKLYTDWANCTLKINHLSKNDSGIYGFRFIKGNHKYMNQHFNLTVTDNPCKVHIMPQNWNKSLKERESLNLHCVSSKACRNYPQWKSFTLHKDMYTEYGVEKRSELKLRLNWTDDGRTLTCRPSESHDDCLESKVTLRVEYAPKETKVNVGKKDVKEGQGVTISCSSKAHPNASFTWFKHQSDFSQHGEILTLYNMTPEKGGSFYCQAKNKHGSENSNDILITVLYPPKPPKLIMVNTVKEDELYTVRCTVESSPPSVLTLTRHSLTHPEKGIITLNEVHNNFINFSKNASLLDAGEYICTAKNTEGESSSKTQLKVLYAPKNVTASANPGDALKEGSQVTLTCNAYSEPQVSAYTWEKFGNTPETHSVRLDQGQEIKIDRLNRSDSAYYLCIASNDIGSARSSSIYIRVMYQPRVMIIHNMTSLGLWEEAIPVHLSCNVQCDPPATFFAWYKLEENTTVLSNDQNYTVEPHNAGTFYCDAHNEVGQSRSDPVEIYLNYFIIKRLTKIIISIVIIICLIIILFLLQRIFLRKRPFWKNAAAQQSFFFSSVSRNNIRENLVTEGSTEFTGFRENQSATTPPANRNIQAGRPNSNIHTVYNEIKWQPSMLQHHHTEDDLTMATVKYANLQYNDSNNPNKSVPSRDDCETVYTQVQKNKQTAKEHKSGLEDYENICGGYAPKKPFPKTNWDLDSSESDEEVNYTKVSFTVTSQHNPRKEMFSSDEEDKTEYSEVKI